MATAVKSAFQKTVCSVRIFTVLQVTEGGWETLFQKEEEGCAPVEEGAAPGGSRSQFISCKIHCQRI